MRLLTLILILTIMQAASRTAAASDASRAQGIYLRGYSLAENSADKSPDSTSTAATDAMALQSEEVPLVQDGGVFDIPVRINGAITLNFVIDSGASDVQIPLDVFSTLIRANTIVPSDMTGTQSYVLADGSKHNTKMFLLRELRIGNFVLHNVTASVGPPAGQLLLGQSFLSQFDTWALDNKKHRLKLVGEAAVVAHDAAPPGNSPKSLPVAAAAVPPPPVQPSVESAILCGRPVEYTIDRNGDSAGFLGVWTGNWNDSDRLCGALIVENIEPVGAADVIYVYGPNRPGSRLSWKQQHRSAVLSDHTLSFQDDQGSMFHFYPAGSDALRAIFVSRSGRLRGYFEKSR